jgi:D-3-phosphoglycerate dehydrogenase
VYEFSRGKRACKKLAGVMRLKFVFLDQDELISHDSYLDPLRKYGEVALYGDVPTTKAEIIRRAQHSDVIFFALTHFTKEILDGLPNLKILQFLGTGVWDRVDVEYARSKGIKVLNVEGYGNNAVAEFTIACTLSLARNIPRADRRMREKKWSLRGLRGIEIKGSTFGIVGTGKIGSLVAKKASLLGANVIAYDVLKSEELQKVYKVKYVTLKELFSMSDIISIHAKATKENVKLINRELINTMPRNTLFINTARAELVDYESLYEALANNKIKGAAIDVFECEPPLDFKLSNLDNVITTPHMGFYTQRSGKNLLNRAISSVINEIKAGPNQSQISI